MTAARYTSIDEAVGDRAAIAVLTHGAGGNRDSGSLVRIGKMLAENGIQVMRLDLPYRRLRPKGPPITSAQHHDREAIVEAAVAVAEPGLPLIIGGHSYGGRMASMAQAEFGVADALLLMSYPLHPPGRPERLRVEHFPEITVPTVFVHGARDPFGTSVEFTTAVALLGGPAYFVDIAAAGHDLVVRSRAAQRR